MDEQQTLAHLLEVEKNAAGIVEEAQTEANRLINENERDCRAVYERSFAQRLTEIEADFNRKIKESDAAYQIKLEEYKQSLAAIVPDKEAFFALAEKYLFEESAGG
jgi:regulator of protease activity HflC (stomatin/prohibitin superfamily)